MLEFEESLDRFPVAVRKDVEVTIPNRTGPNAGDTTVFHVDLITFDQWEGMAEYITQEAFEFPPPPDESEGHKDLRETIETIVGEDSESESRRTLDRIASSALITVVTGHRGDFNGWFFADHPLRPQQCMRAERFMELIATLDRNYGAAILQVCNPGRYEITHSPIPVFYAKGPLPFLLYPTSEKRMYLPTHFHAG